MSGTCLCQHGYGQHEQWESPLRVFGGKVEYFESLEAAPQFCSAGHSKTFKDRQHWDEGPCECREFVERYSRWYRVGDRKSCWFDMDIELPICGKRIPDWQDTEYARERRKGALENGKHVSHQPRVNSKCVGCLRALGVFEKGERMRWEHPLYQKYGPV